MRQVFRHIATATTVTVLATLAACGSVPTGPDAQYSSQNQYPAQYPAQGQYPAQYPSQSQYPAQNQYPGQYPSQYPSQNPYPAQNQQNPNYAEYGRVSNIEVFQTQAEGRGTGLGAILGGVAGGVIGHQIGGGTGRDVATIAGLVGGAVAGNAVEKSRNPGVGQAYRITVQLDNGAARAYDMPSPGELRIGDRVRVQNNQLFRY